MSQKDQKTCNLRHFNKASVLLDSFVDKACGSLLNLGNFAQGVANYKDINQISKCSKEIIELLQLCSFCVIKLPLACPSMNKHKSGVCLISGWTQQRKPLRWDRFLILHPASQCQCLHPMKFSERWWLEDNVQLRMVTLEGRALKLFLGDVVLTRATSTYFNQRDQPNRNLKRTAELSVSVEFFAKSDFAGYTMCTQDETHFLIFPMLFKIVGVSF